MAANERRLPGKAGNFGGTGHLGFAVGDPTYLESSESGVASYFRSIEYGTQGFAERPLGGLFGDRGGPRGGLIEGNLSTFGSGAGQKFVPFNRSGEIGQEGAIKALGYLVAHHEISFAAYRALLKRVKEGATTGPTFSATHKEIAPMNAYQRASDAFSPLQREQDALREVFGRLTIDGKLVFGQGKGRRQPPTGERTKRFVGRTGFIGGFASSQFALSFAKIDQSLQLELTQANRELALALAAEVADTIEKSIKRPGTSTGKLVSATLQPENRFPS